MRLLVPLVLQLAGLVGVTVGGFMVADWGGGIIGAGAVAVYLGLAAEPKGN